MNVTKVRSGKDYTLYRVSSDELPNRAFIFRTSSASKVLYSPNIAGLKLHNALSDLSKVVAGMLVDNELAGVRLSSEVEYILLSGGLY